MFARYKLSTGRQVFRVFNYFFLVFLGLVTLYPFWFVIQSSFSDPTFRMALFWPRGFFYINYWLVFTTEGIGMAYVITILRVIAAVPLMLVVTGAAAFALTRKELKGRKLIITYYFITMFISGGLIPFYMLLKTVGLLNTFWVYVFPVLFSVWTMMAMETSHDEDLLPGVARRAGGGRPNRRGELREDISSDHHAALATDDRNVGLVPSGMALE